MQPNEKANSGDKIETMTNPPEYQAHQPGPAAPVTQPASPAKGLAISALIVGIVAFLMGLLPVVGALAGIAAIVLGAIALGKKQPKGLALTGLILGACALIASIATTAGLGAIGNEISKNPPSSVSAPSTQEGTEQEPEEATEPAKPEKKERLTLDEGWTTQTDEFGMFTTVTGYVSNNSDKAITNYVQITFDTLDAEGANLGTCLANTNTIDANGKWKFEAMCLDDASTIAQVRFKEISGF